MKHQTLSLLLSAGVSLSAADLLPIGGISHIGFRVADLEKTRTFYTGHLGLQEAYSQKDPAGKTTLAVFKVNDYQFFEFSPGTPTGFTHLAFLTQHLDELHQLIATLGLNPPEVRTGHDLTRNFSIKDPDNQRIEFVTYEPDSLQAQSRGKFIDHRSFVLDIHHIGLPVADRAAAIAFFKDKLGFVDDGSGMMHPPKARNDFVEFLPADAPTHISLDYATAEGPLELHDPDGTKIELRAAKPAN